MGVHNMEMMRDVHCLLGSSIILYTQGGGCGRGMCLLPCKAQEAKA